MRSKQQYTNRTIRVAAVKVAEEYLLQKCREIFGEGVCVLDCQTIFYPYYKAQVTISIGRTRPRKKTVVGLVELVEGHVSVLDELEEDVIQTNDCNIIPSRIAVSQARQSLITSISMTVAQQTRLTVVPDIKIEGELELYVPFWALEVSELHNCKGSQRVIFDGLIGSYCIGY